MAIRTYRVIRAAISLFSLILFIYAPASAKIIYVDDNANGLNDGSSWINAYNYLQDALADVNSVHGPVEIIIAGGIYKPDSNSTDPNGSGEREATFQLINGVTLKGGYAGYGQPPDPNAHDIELYETILSGDLDGDDPNYMVYYHHNKLDDNSFHVVRGDGTDPTAILEGVTITGGRGDGGGGMYNRFGNPTVKRCTFRRNHALGGGGMCNVGASPTISNCTFEQNWAESRGGGMYNYDDSKPRLTSCTFISNYVVYMGGACATGIVVPNWQIARSASIQPHRVVV